MLAPIQETNAQLLVAALTNRIWLSTGKVSSAIFPDPKRRETRMKYVATGCSRTCKSAVLFLMLVLTGCNTSGGQLAGPDADRDGQTLVARPNMARLYLIHGFATTGKVNVPSGQPIPGTKTTYFYDKNIGDRTTVATAIAGGPIAGIYAAVAASKAGVSVERPTRGKPLPIAYGYILNGRRVGSIGQGQYMALDLRPGTYNVHFNQPLGWSPDAPLNLEAGETALLLANGSAPGAMGAYFERCDDECGDLVRQGHRVKADLSGIE